MLKQIEVWKNGELWANTSPGWQIATLTGVPQYIRTLIAQYAAGLSNVTSKGGWRWGWK